MLGTHAEIHARQAHVGLGEQRRSDQHHHRDRHLRRHQNATRRTLPAAQGRRSLRGVQRPIERGVAVATEGVQRRSQARGETDQEGHDETESQNRSVDLDLFQPRKQMFGNECQQRVGAPVGEQQAARTADRGQCQALAEHVTDNLPPPRPERGADREFLLSRGHADEQQVRHVHAADEQHAAGRAEQDEQRQP